jgi:hypothetical protein
MFKPYRVVIKAAMECNKAPLAEDLIIQRYFDVWAPFEDETFYFNVNSTTDTCYKFLMEVSSDWMKE